MHLPTKTLLLLVAALQLYPHALAAPVGHQGALQERDGLFRPGNVPLESELSHKLENKRKRDESDEAALWRRVVVEPKVSVPKTGTTKTGDSSTTGGSTGDSTAHIGSGDTTTTSGSDSSTVHIGDDTTTTTKGSTLQCRASSCEKPTADDTLSSDEESDKPTTQAEQADLLSRYEKTTKRFTEKAFGRADNAEQKFQKFYKTTGPRNKVTVTNDGGEKVMEQFSKIDAKYQFEYQDKTKWADQWIDRETVSVKIDKGAEQNPVVMSKVGRNSNGIVAFIAKERFADRDNNRYILPLTDPVKEQTDAIKKEKYLPVSEISFQQIKASGKLTGGEKGFVFVAEKIINTVTNKVIQEAHASIGKGDKYELQKWTLAANPTEFKLLSATDNVNPYRQMIADHKEAGDTFANMDIKAIYTLPKLTAGDSRIYVQVE